MGFLIDLKKGHPGQQAPGTLRFGLFKRGYAVDALALRLCRQEGPRLLEIVGCQFIHDFNLFSEPVSEGVALRHGSACRTNARIPIKADGKKRTRKTTPNIGMSREHGIPSAMGRTTGMVHPQVLFICHVLKRKRFASVHKLWSIAEVPAED
jgi:hypothetical protein